MRSSRFGRARGLILLLCLLAVRPAHADDAKRDDPKREESWAVMSVQGQRVGYSHQVVTHLTGDDGPFIRSELHSHSAVKRFGSVMTFIIDQTVDENPDGTLRRLRYRQDNPPVSRLDLEVVVRGEKVLVTLISGEQKVERELDRPKDLKSPMYHERFLEQSPLKAGEQVQMQTFEPQLNSFLTLRFTGMGEAEFELPGQSKQRGSRVQMEFLTGIPGVKTDFYLDDKGQSILAETPLLNTKIWNTTREVALEEIPTDVDLGLSAIVRVKGFENAHSAGELVLRATAANGLSADRFPQGETQAVRKIDDKTLELTLRSVRPNGVESLPAGKDLSPIAADLASSSFAATGDARIIELAESAASPGTSPAKVAVACERLVHDWLDQKNMTSNLATASEVVRSREGDCTEHAVLLTALLRVRKIPARVAVGLVYADELKALVGHAWTEAWLNGRWVPLDATLAQGGIGCGHLKLMNSSLEDGDVSLVAGSIAVWHLVNSVDIQLLGLTPAAKP